MLAQQFIILMKLIKIQVNIIKVIHYQPDGKAIKYIAERDQDTMLFIKKNHFFMMMAKQLN
ncbi:MAG: hypothetical protein DF280_01900 ['Brassica napus' phytoplasma]|nr:MAG: hypothetical protein DF280_01900 ['Brassica napus' phytoplasma]